MGLLDLFLFCKQQTGITFLNEQSFLSWEELFGFMIKSYNFEYEVFFSSQLF